MRYCLLALLPLALCFQSAIANERTCPPLPVPEESYEASFQQIRSISGLTRPLRSEGRVEIHPGEFILWRVERPFPMSVTVGHDGFVIHSSDVPERHDSSLHQSLGALLLSLHSGNIDEHFVEVRSESEPHCQPSSGGIHERKYRPRSAELRRVLDTITVSGAQTIERLELRDQRGDVTSVTLSDVQPLAASRIAAQ